MSDLNDQSKNVSIHNELTDVAVTTTTDGSKERLDVSSKSTNNTLLGGLVGNYLLNGGSKDMNVDGSSTPVSFQNGPASGKLWYVFSLSIIIEDKSMSFAKFGGLPALANGCVFYAKSGGGAETEIATVNRNADFYLFANDLLIESSVDDILVAKYLPVVNAGTSILLTGSLTEYFKVTINDDLTGLTNYYVTIGGYEVDA